MNAQGAIAGLYGKSMPRFVSLLGCLPEVLLRVAFPPAVDKDLAAAQARQHLMGDGCPIMGGLRFPEPVMLTACVCSFPIWILFGECLLMIFAILQLDCLFFTVEF